MAEIVNPEINKIINEDIRPLAEKARALFAQAQMLSLYGPELVAQLEQLDNADVLNDNRINEGVRPLTVLQLKNCINLLTDLLTTVNADSRLPSVLGACVRKSVNIG